MKKWFLVLFIVFLCFGCKARYELKINDDLSIDEKITGLEDDNFYSKYYRSTKSRVVNFVIATQQEYLDGLNFKVVEFSENKLYGAYAKKNYSNIDDYLANSIAYQQYYEKMNIKNEDGIIEISTDNKLNRNTQDFRRYVVDEGTISITVPFKVLENNADRHSKNTYVWDVDSGSGKNIFIKFDSKKINNNSKYDVIIFGTVCLVVIIGIVLLVKIYQKKQLIRNDI